LSRPASERWLSGLAWAPGSDRLALTLTTPETGHSTLAVMSLDGSGLPVLRDSAGLYAPAWSNDRTLYYLRPSMGAVDLMRLELRPNGSAAGPPAPVALGVQIPSDSRRLPLGSLLSISRDDRVATFLRQERWSNLARIRLGSGEQARNPELFTMGTALFLAARMSRDASRMAVFRTTADGVSLGTSPTAGGGFAEIATVGEAGQLAWSPNGRSLAFTAFNSRTGLSLALHDFESGTTKSVQARVGAHLDWGPEGLVVQALGNRQLSLLEPETGALRPLVSGDSASWVFYPTISPDGHHVAYVRSSGGGLSIRVVKSDGSEDHELLRDNARPVGWSSDGRTVFAARYGSTVVDQLLGVPAAGGVPRVLLTLPSGYRVEDVSRDGRLLMVNQEESRSDAWRIALAGGTTKPERPR
jgi:Tol biopolymer transport system component